MSRTQLAVSFFSVVPKASKESCQEHRDWIEAFRNHDIQRSMAIIRYQRCRSNLELMHTILTDDPALEINHFLKQAASAPDAKDCVREFLPIFEDILKKNDYTKF